MNKFATTTLILVLLSVNYSLFSQTQQLPMVLWYNQPAKQLNLYPYGEGIEIYKFMGSINGWNEALPIGNGRMGAMVFGGVTHERIQLNEETLWDGYKQNTLNPKAKEALPSIRKLLFEGKNEEASAMAEKCLLSIPTSIKSFQTLGDLYIDMPAQTKNYSKYYRDLNIDSALAHVSYLYDGKLFTREMFASHPNQVIVIKYNCNQPAGLDMKISMIRECNAQTINSPTDKNLLIQQGQITAYDSVAGINKGMKFETHIKVINNGGEVESNNGTIHVKNANEVIIYIAAATNYVGRNPSQICQQNIANVCSKTYTQLRKAHTDDYTTLFNRTKIRISNSNPFEKPINERIEAAQQRKYDAYNTELAFQFGRYALIASSRLGDLPANLQGIWSQHIDAPWNSDYHTNINLQMNYWPAEITNLTECHLPLFDLIDSVALYGQSTAKGMYGANGWMMHHLTDIFWRTTPVDGVCGVWPFGGAWLMRHMWEHYLFTNDKDFLINRAYPLMKGSAQFLLDFLVEVPKGLPFEGRLVTNPSHSPENAYEDEYGVQSMFTYGATMDLQITHDLFTNCIQTIDIINGENGKTDLEFKAKLQTALNRLVPLQISPKTGKIQEWIKDYKEIELGHRHFSHLYGLYPGNQITIAGTPELAKAAGLVLDARLRGNPNAAIEEANNKFASFDSYINGEGGGNWQRAWITALWARLYNAEKAFDSHKKHIGSVMMPNMTGDGCVQLDGTFGLTAAVAEMLLQSHEGFINILPALPNEWANGSISGFRARGGFTVDIVWKNGKPTSINILPNTNNKCKILINKAQITSIASGGKPVNFTTNNNIVEFNAVAKQLYVISL